MIPPHAEASARRWLILGIVASALFMICVDMTVLYTALPVLTRELHASTSQKLWIVNAYALVVAGLLPGLGTLGDRRGYRLLFLAGLGVFGAASLAAALAPTAAWLIAARVLLGVGGAAMMPSTLAIIRHSFEDTHERSVAIGLWAGIAAGGLALGPVIGGLVLSRYPWGAVFLINLPVVLAAFVLTLLLVPRRRPTGTAAWDLAGSLLVMGGLFGIVYAIKELARLQVSVPALLSALVLGSALLTLFARRQRSRAEPLIDFSLFRLPGFAAAVMAATVSTTGIVGFELVLGLHLQLVLERSPLQAGLMILPIPLGSFLAAPVAGRLLRRYGHTPVAATGLLLSAAAALGVLALPLASAGLTAPQTVLFVFIGAGAGAAATAASTAIMSGAPPGRSGMAASIEEVAYELGGTFGVAIFGSLMTLVYAGALVLPQELAQLAPAVRDSLDDALRTADALPTPAAAALRTLSRQAFTSAFQAVIAGAALLWTLAAVLILTPRWRGRGDAGAAAPPPRVP